MQRVSIQNFKNMSRFPHVVTCVTIADGQYCGFADHRPQGAFFFFFHLDRQRCIVFSQSDPDGQPRQCTKSPEEEHRLPRESGHDDGGERAKTNHATASA